MGRKRETADGGPRTNTILLRLSDDEQAAIATAARLADLTPTGWAAEAAVAAATGREAPRADPARQVLVELMQTRTQLRRAGTNLNQAVTKLNTTGIAPDWLGAAVAELVEAVAVVEAASEAASRAVARGRR